METYQQIRIGNISNLYNVTRENPFVIRYNAQTKKDYKYVKGIYVSMPHESVHAGAYLSMRIGQMDLFEQEHETKLLSCGYNVAPNDMFFQIGHNIEAAGSEVEGRLKFTQPIWYSDFQVIIYLWLTNAAK